MNDQPASPGPNASPSADQPLVTAAAIAQAVAPSVSATALQQVEKVGLDALTGSLASLAGGAPAADVAAAVAGTAAAAAGHVAGQLIEERASGIESRLAELEQGAAGFFNHSAFAQGVFSILNRFFPHETQALAALLPPKPPAEDKAS